MYVGLSTRYDKLPVCLCVSFGPNTISAHPSAVVTHKVSFQPRRYTSLQLSRPSACGITRSNPLHDLCCMLSPHFPSHSPLPSADMTPAAIFKDVVRTRECDAGRLKLATRLLERNKKSTYVTLCDWLRFRIALDSSSLRFTLDGF